MATDSRASLMQSGLNLIGQALSIFDADLRLAVSNRQYQAMFDLPDNLTRPGAFFEDTVRYLVLRGEYGPQDDPDEAIRARVAQARAFLPHYLERQRPDGQWISVEGAPLGQGGWITVYTDITDAKRQEELLRARSEELSEQLLTHAARLTTANRELAATITALQEAKRVVTETQSRTRQVTEMVPAHIAHMDAEYRYLFSNRQLPKVFPGTPRDIVGLTAEQALGRETFAAIRPHLDRALTGRAQVFEITHPDSGRRIRVALTPDRSGTGAYILSTDVTAETELRSVLTQASRRELAAQITSGLAHDFGNLLTIILGLQDRLARADLPDAQARADVQATLAAARRGAELLSRIGQIAAPRSPALQPVALGCLLEDLCVMARPTLGPQVKLVLEADLPDGALMLDPGLVQDSLLNLFLNARDAMGEAGGTITLTAHATGPWVTLTVRDTGPGFAPAVLPRATEPFFTTKSRNGSGLGLSMVFDQTRRAGGTLHVANHPEGGAEIKLRLPLRRVDPQMVLLVEDDDSLREVLRDMLTAMGHSVIEAASLSEAQSLADLPDLTVILSDLQLGDGLGLDLATASGPPLILMTALPPDDALRRDAPCPVLTKPFDAATLAGALSELDPRS